MIWTSKTIKVALDIFEYYDHQIKSFERRFDAKASNDPSIFSQPLTAEEKNYLGMILDQKMWQREIENIK